MPGMMGGNPPRSSYRGALGCQACGISRALCPYAHRCPQQRWLMRPATCVWPRTPWALWRSSLPSGCKVSCGERATPTTPGDSAAEQGLMPRARSQCRQTQHLVPPRGPPALGLQCPRPWVCIQRLGTLAWLQPPPGTESIWGTLITESQPPDDAKRLRRPDSIIVAHSLCTRRGADSFRRVREVSSILQLWKDAERSPRGVSPPPEWALSTSAFV